MKTEQQTDKPVTVPEREDPAAYNRKVRRLSRLRAQQQGTRFGFLSAGELLSIPG